MASKSTTLLTFLAGASAGALAGILLAPEKGEETRKRLLKRVQSLRKELEDTMDSGISLFKDLDDSGYNPLRSA